MRKRGSGKFSSGCMIRETLVLTGGKRRLRKFLQSCIIERDYC